MADNFGPAIRTAFYSFLDFIVTKAMGKTGPLWEFDAVGEFTRSTEEA